MGCDLVAFQQSITRGHVSPVSTQLNGCPAPGLLRCALVVLEEVGALPQDSLRCSVWVPLQRCGC